MEKPRYLKSRKDGFVYVWHELILRGNPDDLYEVTEEEAFPERFISPEAKARTSTVSAKLETPDAQVDKATKGTPPELAKDAAKGLQAKGLG